MAVKTELAALELEHTLVACISGFHGRHRHRCLAGFCESLGAVLLAGSRGSLTAPATAEPGREPKPAAGRSAQRGRARA